MAGAAGLLLGAMLIAAFVLDFVIIGTTGGPPIIALASLGADLQRARDSALWPIETWLYTLQIVPFAVFIVGVRSVFQGTDVQRLADMATLAAVLFMVLHTLHNLAILAVVQVLAPAYVPGGADGPAIEAVSRGLLGLANAAFTPGGGVGGIFLGLAGAGFAIAEDRSRALASPWAGRLAAATAGLAALGFLQYVVPAALVVALIGWLAFIGWVAAASAALVRTAPRATTTVSPQPA